MVTGGIGRQQFDRQPRTPSGQAAAEVWRPLATESAPAAGRNTSSNEPAEESKGEGQAERLSGFTEATAEAKGEEAEGEHALWEDGLWWKWRTTSGRTPSGKTPSVSIGKRAHDATAAHAQGMVLKAAADAAVRPRMNGQRISKPAASKRAAAPYRGRHTLATCKSPMLCCPLGSNRSRVRDKCRGAQDRAGRLAPGDETLACSIHRTHPFPSHHCTRI